MSIVVGYVPTREGRAALQVAVEECELRKAPLVVVDSARDGRSFDPSDVEAFQADLDAGQARLASVGLSVQTRQPAGGDPAEDLVQAAEDTGALCIVIGLRRRSPVGKLILGSNAQRILLDAHCPVLAVKADEPS